MKFQDELEALDPANGRRAEEGSRDSRPFAGSEIGACRERLPRRLPCRHGAGGRE